jgi:membrane protease YdiL (CAAX protease family)
MVGDEYKENCMETEHFQLRSRIFQTALLTLGIGFLVFVTNSILLHNVNFALRMVLSQLLVNVVVPVALFLNLKLDIPEFAGLRAASARNMALGFFAGLFNYFAWAIPLMFVAEKVFPAHLVKSESESLVSLFSNRSPLELGVIIFCIVLLAPLCEELFFRGFVQSGLGRLLSPTLSIGLTAAAFSAFHLQFVAFIPRLQLGLLFGFTRMKTKSLWPNVAAHMANNMVALVLFSVGSKTVESSDNGLLVAGCFALGNAALLFLSRFLENEFPATRE